MIPTHFKPLWRKALQKGTFYCVISPTHFKPLWRKALRGSV